MKINIFYYILLNSKFKSWYDILIYILWLIKEYRKKGNVDVSIKKISRKGFVPMSFLSRFQGMILFTAQKMKFSIRGIFSKCDQIRWKLRIWSHLLKKSLMENFIFCAVFIVGCSTYGTGKGYWYAIWNWFNFFDGINHSTLYHE